MAIEVLHLPVSSELVVSSASHVPSSGLVGHCVHIGEPGNLNPRPELHLPGSRAPCGCYNTTIVDSFVLDDALVQDTFLLHRTYVSHGAVVVGCGTITCSGTDVTNGNGTVLKVGVEIGGREIAMFADMPFHLAAVVGETRGNVSELKAYEDLVRTYTKKVQCDGFNVIAHQAKVSSGMT
ncbi:hypothetical protein B5M09_002701 [Aphanomyces astaci]|uniref:Uncharacterized protein n=1 Tax=Aphanomyces astaci TaxID=112090 RepID=A0A3R8CQB8_APHAT|nr:hypothetical protein B5M09_002701 [Aphanomyces astaci]